MVNNNNNNNNNANEKKKKENGYRIDSQVSIVVSYQFKGERYPSLVPGLGWGYDGWRLPFMLGSH